MSAGTASGDAGAHLRQLAALEKRGLPPDGGERFNRLIFAASPYLLQHAENPVDWFPWGDEAFGKAAAEDKPVFLSIGYATCHWCHVMARESFGDGEAAAVLNRHFVAIKVDREERPDIDDRYMTVSRLMTGSGGWPLNVFLTPDRRPFLTMTYLPRIPRNGVPGFIALLENLALLWERHREKIEKNCASVMAALRRPTVSLPPTSGARDLAGEAARQLELLHDPEWGGFGTAPKFPMPVNLAFLLRLWNRRGKPRFLVMAERSFRQMLRGGIWDQLGGGFHRYSVDREWLVPHFEKMLYDQALMASVAVDLFRATSDPLYLTAADELLAFVLRELADPEGGFHAALDADSEGVEGKFYLWRREEIVEVLGADEGEFFCRMFNVTAAGNFEGATVLSLPSPPEDVARREGMTAESLAESLARWRRLLLAEREKRIGPIRDEKVLTAWNGLMVSALADAYAVTGREEYRCAAGRCADFLARRLTREDGRLMRSFFGGGATVPGFLEDYAFYAAGMVALFEATLDPAHLETAGRLCREMLRLFRDDGSGGLFETGADAEVVLARTLDAADSVIPAANAVAAETLVKLGRIIGDEGLVAAGRGIVSAFSGRVSLQPAGYLGLLMAGELPDHDPVEITLAGRRDIPEMSAMLRVIGRRFIPDLVLSSREEGSDVPAAIVCAAGACLPPVSDAGALGNLLDGIV